MSLWVTVTGPPRSICSRNLGTTLPVDPSTLPKRTLTIRVRSAAKLWHSSSASRFDAPMTLVGLTALSVDTNTSFSTPFAIAACATRHVPSELLRTASQPLPTSAMGTCL